MAESREILQVAGREVPVTHPERVVFPQAGHTKLDLVNYYLSVAPAVLAGVYGRPMALKRFVHGVEGEAFYQKRAPQKRPEWVEVVELRFPSGRSAEEIVVRDAATLAWVVNLGSVDLHPHPVRADNLSNPDELRVDLDPVPGVPWSRVRRVALVVREVLADMGLTGWPKTSGSRGFHVFCRIERRWTFTQVRAAALALAREVERRAPDLATSKWWKEERHGVFVDYNQNAKDRTTASAYSVRPTPDARVSTPLRWDEVPDCEPEAFTMLTVPERYAVLGDPAEGMDEAPGSLDALLELADRDKAAGLADAPWPPHFDKQPDEPTRARPSVRRAPAGSAPAGSAPAGSAPAGSAPAGSAPAGSAPAGDGAAPAGRRRSTKPLIEIARAASTEEAMAGLERWKARHPEVWPLLEPADVLVDSMRGRSSTWTRIRLNLQHVPVERRPVQEPLEVDFDPWAPRTGRGRQS